MNPYLFPLLNQKSRDSLKSNQYSEATTIDDIVEATCLYFGISKEDLVAHNRKRGIIVARKIICYLGAWRFPLIAIAVKVGLTDHSSVIHHRDDIIDKLSIKDKELILHINNISNEIKKIKS
jgi:chromosomal replication initiation ATPase DnaA